MMDNVLDSLIEYADTHAVSQVMVFDDDSLDVQFKDKSAIQLSACGANYQFIRCSVGAPTHPDSNNVIRQRCCFATSETKSKVEFAIKWRNHFAQRPYIPSQFSHLYDGGIVHLHRDVTSFDWPNKCKSTDTSLNCVSVEAKDELAELTLNKNLHYVSVVHLVKISPSTSQSETPLSSPCVNRTQSATSSSKTVNKNEHVAFEQANERRYIWNKHVFPVSSCPTYWKYPLAVAMQCMDPQDDDQSLKLINLSHAPCPLSGVCKKQFEHVWRMGTDLSNSDQPFPYKVEDQGNGVVEPKSLKMLWNNGVVYWINPKALQEGTDGEKKQDSKQHAPIVEAWLTDGSILNSTPSTNYYFIHFKINENVNTKSNVHRMYSPTVLPTDTGLKTIILRSIRLRCYAEQKMKNCNKTLDLKKCWHDSLMGFSNNSATSDALHGTDVDTFEKMNEKVVIPELGTFTAVGGSIQVWFKDGTAAYVAISKMQLEALKRSQECLATLPCRVLTSNGHHTTCDNLLNSEDYLFVYLQPMFDWLMWLSTSKSERWKKPFYSDTIFSSSKLNMISAELEKINRFNYLLEQNVSMSSSENDSKYKSSSIDESVSNEVSNMRGIGDISNIGSSLSQTPLQVADALENTSQAITDIDEIIKNLRCQLN